MRRHDEKESKQKRSLSTAFAASSVSTSDTRARSVLSRARRKEKRDERRAGKLRAEAQMRRRSTL